MTVKVENATWEEFRKRASEFCRQADTVRTSVLFRGQGDSAWRLRPTVDRLREFSDRARRIEFVDNMVRQFWGQAEGLHSHRLKDVSPGERETLARHYGLPSIQLDWTRSPYVATFFAFWQAKEPTSGRVSVWVLDRRWIMEEADVVIDEEIDLDVHNVRRAEQQAVVVSLRGNQGFLDAVAPRAFTRIDLPWEERRMILAELESMTISGRSVFRTLQALALDVAERRMGMIR